MHWAEYPIYAAVCMLRTVEPTELKWDYLQDCHNVSGIALVLN